MKPRPLARACEIASRLALLTFIGLASCDDRATKAQDQAIPSAEQQERSGVDDPAALVALGDKLLEGADAEPSRALDLYLRAAEAGSADAKAAAGELLLEGDVGVVVDPERGMALIREAHEAGAARGTLALAGALSFDDPVPDDYQAALDLLSDLREKSNGRAHAIAARAHYQLSRSAVDPEGKRRQEREALGAARAGHAMGEPRATIALSIFSEEGIGMEPDLQQSYRLAIAAANQGHSSGLIKAAWHTRDGRGVRKDYARARELLLKATTKTRDRRRLALAFEALSDLSANGQGVHQSYVNAYAWSILAVESGATLDLVAAEKQLSPDQVVEAQRATTAWRPGVDIDRSRAVREGLQGTASLISASGHALTNAHVVEGCDKVNSKSAGPGSVIAVDRVNDLAVVKFDVPNGNPLDLAAAAPAVGEAVYVFGFPLSGVLSDQGNLTSGVLSAKSGAANNSSQFQITAPVQPGSSGSPVLDSTGHLVGVVVSQADTIKMIAATGQAGQNLNFAVDVSVVERFLATNSVPYERARASWFGGAMDPPEIANLAARATISVGCATE
jgi:hypothetical protein